MALNARLILIVGFLVAMLIAFFVWAESTLPPASPPATLSSDSVTQQAQDPIMQQAQKNLFSLHELMHKIQETQDPDKRRELTQEHMRTMQEQMRVMQGMIQGICGMGPVGQDDAEVTRRVSSPTYFR